MGTTKKGVANGLATLDANAKLKTSQAPDTPSFTGDVTAATGNVAIATAGKGVTIKGGTNARIGSTALTAGSKVVANTSVTANTIILLTSQVDGGTPGSVRVSARTAGTSFTITSSSGSDTSTVGYVLVEPT